VTSEVPVIKKKSNASIAFILVGIIPFMGGVGSLAAFLLTGEPDANAENISKILFLLIFGAASCSFRSYLYLTSSEVTVKTKVLFWTVKKKIYNYTEFSEIRIDIFGALMSSGESGTHRYYTIELVGRYMGVDIRDYIKNNILGPKGFATVYKLAEDIRALSDLKIIFSEEVKSIHNMNE
jgi:hypothetical protein